jgi:hypothetical protein
LGVRIVASRTKLNSCVVIPRARRSLLSTYAVSKVARPPPASWNVNNDSFVASPDTASRNPPNQEPRRNSPSVIAESPTLSWSAIASPIQRSWTARNAVASRRPAWKSLKASFRACGRSKLPTWSARNGGDVRLIAFEPPGGRRV